MRTKVLAAVGMAAVGVQLILVGRERDAVRRERMAAPLDFRLSVRSRWCAGA